jgi:hypothetical protein
MSNSSKKSRRQARLFFFELWETKLECVDFDLSKTTLTKGIDTRLGALDTDFISG